MSDETADTQPCPDPTCTASYTLDAVRRLRETGRTQCPECRTLIRECPVPWCQSLVDARDVLAERECPDCGTPWPVIHALAAGHVASDDVTSVVEDGPARIPPEVRLNIDESERRDISDLFDDTGSGEREVVSE